MHSIAKSIAQSANASSLPVTVAPAEQHRAPASRLADQGTLSYLEIHATYVSATEMKLKQQWTETSLLR